jgi:mono/diheme cytochrome c family protein
VTEVPEHLLRRSQERRAALGLGGGEGGPPAGGGNAGAAPEGSSAATPVRAEAATPVTPAPAAPPAPPEPPKPPPPWVSAALSRPKVPKWAIPVLAALPLWALVYAGTLYVPSAASADPVLAEGEEIYAQQCASCHGGEGGGGTGRPLSNGDVLLTFPDPADHVAWVDQGSALVGEGNPYGDPNRPGGQHIAGETAGGLMPAFGEALSEEQIIAVVRYEREILSGEMEPALATSGEGAGPADSPANEAQSEGGDTGGGG